MKPLALKLAGCGDVPAEPIPAAQVIAGSPHTRTWVLYEDAAAGLSAGQWEATVGSWRVAYGEWEYVTMISGRCTLTGDDGSVVTAGPGDSFVVEPGFTGVWQVVETMHKHWVIKNPP